ncbi:MAG: hypothetical protein FJW39_00895 [Acidobacteria bacterium]|nr:hypothetical protein [Acidobacteriota bacterium]
MITRRGLLAALAARPSGRMNVVVILADDLGYGDLGCFGSVINRTPHLDRLAADGLRLTHHYSGSPVCSAARASLLTGLVPERTGVTGVLREEHDEGGLRLGIKTMADHFRAQGYKTALIGKWHLGMKGAYRPDQRGFDSFWGFLNGTLDYNTHLSAGGGGRGTRTTYENGTPLKLDGYLPELLAAKVVEFVESHRDRPYFLYLAHPLPHLPLQVPARWLNPAQKGQQAVYSGMVACLDGCVGQLRAALERTGQWERTIVVFASDNGWVKSRTPTVAAYGSNGPLRGGKYELFEGGIRTPCIVRWPGVTRAGSVSSAVSWFPDWVPALAGVKTTDGRDIRKQLSGHVGDNKRTLVWRFEDSLVKTPPSVAVRQGRWKYLRVGTERFLFDLDADPGEARDVSRENPSVIERLVRAAD